MLVHCGCKLLLPVMLCWLLLLRNDATLRQTLFAYFMAGAGSLLDT